MSARVASTIPRGAGKRSGHIKRAAARCLGASVLSFALLSSTLLVAGPSAAAEDASLLKDLTSTLSLLKLPCGRVISARRIGGKVSDQLVSCTDGNRYRIFVDADDRVVARKQ